MKWQNDIVLVPIKGRLFSKKKKKKKSKARNVTLLNVDMKKGQFPLTGKYK
jgi:hypothetical protein